MPKTKGDSASVCQRCYQILHYGRLAGGSSVTEEHFYRAINTATGKADLTLLVADFFDPEGSFGPNWADFITDAGIRLLVNKADLIPPKTPWEEIQNHLAD